MEQPAIPDYGVWTDDDSFTDDLPEFEGEKYIVTAESNDKIGPWFGMRKEEQYWDWCEDWVDAQVSVKLRPQDRPFLSVVVRSGEVR